MSWYCRTKIDFGHSWDLKGLERFSYDLEKWFQQFARYLFCQPMDEKIKTWTLRFPAEETLIWRMHCSIGQSCCSMPNYRWISRKFFGHEVFSPERLLSQPKPTRVCIRSINQSNRSISVFCCFCFVRAFSFQGHTKIALTLTNCGYGFCPHKTCLGFRRVFVFFSLS